MDWDCAAEGIPCRTFLQGADPSRLDRMGCTPLDDAIRHGHPEVQALLRAKGVLLTGHADAMCKAAASGDIDTLRVLISNGMDPSGIDYDGRTALHLACSCNQLGAIHFLLNYHHLPEYKGLVPCNISPIDAFGGTPLDDALRHGHDVVAILLRGSGGISTQQDDPSVVAEARQRQERAHRDRQREECTAAALKVSRASKEAKRAAVFQSHAAYLDSEAGKLARESASAVHSQLQALISKELEYASKVRLKRARNSDTTAHATRLRAMHASVAAFASALAECVDVLEHPPAVPVPAQRLLAAQMATEGDAEGADTLGAPLDEGRAHRQCLAGVRLLHDVAACLEAML